MRIKKCIVDINFAEYFALVYGLWEARDSPNLIVYSDSLNALQWMNGRPTPKHRDYQLVSKMRDIVLKDRADLRLYTKFCKVKAHSGIYGNEQADLLARVGSSPSTVATWNLEDLIELMDVN